MGEQMQGFRCCSNRLAEGCAESMVFTDSFEANNDLLAGIWNDKTLEASLGGGNLAYWLGEIGIEVFGARHGRLIHHLKHQEPAHIAI